MFRPTSNNIYSYSYCRIWSR